MRKTASGERPEAAAGSKNVLLAGVSLGFVVVQLDVTIVNVALQPIGASFGGSVSGLQWIVNAHTLACAALILTAGALDDRLGAKRVFIAGFAAIGWRSIFFVNLPLAILGIWLVSRHSEETSER